MLSGHGTIGDMCRYRLDRYRTHFVCVACRRVRKDWSEAAATCTGCGSPMVAAGRDFHAPRRADRRQWRKVAALLDDGTRFDGCGCRGGGHIPSSYAMVRAGIAARERADSDSDPLAAASRRRDEARRGRTPTFGHGRVTR